MRIEVMTFEQFEHMFAEAIRADLLARMQADPQPREAFEALGIQVYNTSEVADLFELVHFEAPLVVVRRWEDGELGSMFFQHEPRLYWGFSAHVKD
jgi:hypothetical protein